MIIINLSMFLYDNIGVSPNDFFCARDFTFTKSFLLFYIFISVFCVKQARNGMGGGRGAFVQRSGFGNGVEGSGYIDIGDT